MDNSIDAVEPPISCLRICEFRQFRELMLDKLIWTNIIMGANGSGKTSVLWALVIALHSFNIRTVESKKQRDQEITIPGMDFSILINGLHLNTASWTYISRNGSSTPTEIESTIEQRSISWAIKGNGVISFTEKKALDQDPASKKIRFAFMAESAFQWPTREPAPGDILTSAAGGIRRRFSKLAKKGELQVPSISCAHKSIFSNIFFFTLCRIRLSDT